MTSRTYSKLDQFIMQVDSALSTIVADLKGQRENPAADITGDELMQQEQKHSAGLMRVNHSGEVCAQALYEGQMLVSRKPETKSMLSKARDEEIDHLAWTHERLRELGSHRSFLNPIWYVNSYLIGVVAGLAGDRWSLGFVEETERQVSAHLESHLDKLPQADKKSRAIVAQMKIDEEHHGQSAVDYGAKPLPGVVKTMMKFHGRVMTTLAYWV